MIIRLLTSHRSVMIGLCLIFSIFLAQPIYAQTYELNVGEKYTLPYPTPPAGAVDHIGTGRCTNKSDCISVTGLDIKVYNYFTGTATIEVEYNYTYIGIDNKRHIGNGTAYYSVKCKPTEVKLSKTSLELEPGDEVELSYSTSPSGLEPEVEWRTSDKSVATLSSGTYYNRETISYEKKVYVCAESVGTCVIKLGCNTGYAAPTCSVTVKDDRPHLTADIPSGSVSKGTRVTLTCDRAGADIRYTTNGSEPSKTSQKYTSPIIINESITLKAIAYDNGVESRILERKYQVIAHVAGEVFTAKSVEGVDITFKAYAINTYAGTGTALQVGTGEQGNSAINKNYTGVLTIPKKVDGMSVNRIAEYAFDKCKLTKLTVSNEYSGDNFLISTNSFRDCQNLSEITIRHAANIASQAFNNCTSLETIVFTGIIAFNNSLSATTVNTASNVFPGCNGIKKITSNSTSAYKINDDVFPSSVYQSAILYVPESAVSTYKSTNGWKKFNNIVAIGTEPHKKLTLSATPSGGEVSANTIVTLTVKAEGSNISGCDIYYTTNGSTPSKNNGTKYSSGITISSACTLKAIAYKSGYTDSDVLTATYTIKEDQKPQLVLSASPSGGQVSTGTTVILTTKADGSTVYGCDIYYTTNGTTPSKSNGMKYSSGITINNSCTLKAIAYKSGFEDSEVLTATYTIKENPKPKLVLSASPSGGQVSVGATVILTTKADGSTVYGCDIYYTTNGSTPSKYNGTKYSSGITINCACTLKAIAYKSGFEDSEVLTAMYTIKEDIRPLSKVVAISTGFYHSMALTEDGSVWAWGYNKSGQLGDGTTTDSSVPVKVMNGVSSISAGDFASYIVKKDGALWACGGNSNGELGDGTTTNRTTFVKIMDGVSKVSGGFHHAMILKSDGSLWATGNNSQGQLGDGTTTERHSPVKIMSGVADMDAGYDCSLIIKSDGTLWECGQNVRGLLNEEWDNLDKTPVKIADDVKSACLGGAVSGIRGGELYVMAIKNDGQLWAFGSNGVGQLGDGSTDDRTDFVKIMHGNIAAVAAGHEHTLILEENGLLNSCGLNRDGQLGYGIESSSYYSKYANAIMNGVKAISANSSFSLILMNDGTVWACGNNVFGQLGDGTTTDRCSPVKIIEGSDTGTNLQFVNGSNGNNKGIFSLSGQQLSIPHKGINIVGGKKVIVK